MGVNIRKKRGKLYLDIYSGGKRTWEALHLTLSRDKEQNKEVLRQAEVCRSLREMQLLTGAWNLQDPVAAKKRLVTYLEEYAKKHTSPTAIQCCLYHLKNFPGGAAILLSQVSSHWLVDFQDYLLKNVGISQSTASCYAKALRAALKKAVAANLILRNPSEGVERIKEPETDLVFLNIDELQRLAAVSIDSDYGAELRRAFLFACHTGLRVSDLETLTWGQIEKIPMQIIKRQEKTRNPVFIPLSVSAQRLINDGIEHAPTDKVFTLSDHSRKTSYRHLKNWAHEARVTKNLSWHVARRTFATLELEAGVDIYTVSKLLGHLSIGQVAKYAKVTDRLRREAIAALPEITIAQ